MLETINISLFNLINSFAGKNLFLDKLGIFFAKYLVYLFVLTIIILWFINKKYKNISLYAFYATVFGLIVNYLITLFYYHARPFMLNLGTQLINHSTSTSFPSDHTTILLSIAFMLIYFKDTKRLGVILTIFGLIGGVSRIFCGVHFPFDILGSIVVALIVTYIINLLKIKLKKINNFILNSYYSILKTIKLMQ